MPTVIDSVKEKKRVAQAAIDAELSAGPRPPYCKAAAEGLNGQSLK